MGESKRLLGSRSVRAVIVGSIGFVVAIGNLLIAPSDPLISNGGVAIMAIAFLYLVYTFVQVAPQ